MTLERVKEFGYEMFYENEGVSYFTNIQSSHNKNKGKSGYVICFSKEDDSMISMMHVDAAFLEALTEKMN